MEEKKDVWFTQVVTVTCMAGFTLLTFVAGMINLFHM